MASGRMQARPVGICPIRRELYSQCFDELIRQVAITCAEQGHLLHRIRDELRMTLRSYEVVLNIHHFGLHEFQYALAESIALMLIEQRFTLGFIQLS